MMAEGWADKLSPEELEAIRQNPKDRGINIFGKGARSASK